VIKGILLDLDNTVYDYPRAHLPALAAALHWFELEIAQDFASVEATYIACRKQVNEQLHGLAASHSRLLYFQRVCENFGLLPHRLAPQAEDIYWTVFFENMQLRPGCLAFLESVKLPVAIVSDLTARIQFDKIAALEIFPYITAIVTSEESGHEKPHARIFELAAAKLKLPHHDLVMIGDSIERDIYGASAIGIKSFWLETAEWQHQVALAQEIEGVTVFSEFSQLLSLMQVLR